MVGPDRASCLDMQWLADKLRSAELRAGKVAAEVARLKEAIGAPPPKKRQRTCESRPYDVYTLEEWQRQESWQWTRRRVELSADKAERPPELDHHARSWSL